MSEDEITQIRTHVDYGLARAEWCMLKEKSLHTPYIIYMYRIYRSSLPSTNMRAIYNKATTIRK